MCAHAHVAQASDGDDDELRSLVVTASLSLPARGTRCAARAKKMLYHANWQVRARAVRNNIQE